MRARGDYLKADQLLNGSLAFLSFSLGRIALVGFLFGNEIMSLFWSDTYGTIGPLFGMILVGLQVQVVNTFLGYSLVGAGHPKENSIVLAISTPFMLMLNFILILLLPNGLFGPAIGAIIEGSALNAVFKWLVRRYRFNLEDWHYFGSTLFMIGGIILSVGTEWVFGIADQPYKTWPINIAIMLIYFIGFIQLGTIKMWVTTTSRPSY